MEKKEDLFLLKKLRLNWIFVLIVFQRSVEICVKQLNQEKIKKYIHLDI